MLNNINTNVIQLRFFSPTALYFSYLRNIFALNSVVSEDFNFSQFLINKLVINRKLYKRIFRVNHFEPVCRCADRVNNLIVQTNRLKKKRLIE